MEHEENTKKDVEKSPRSKKVDDSAQTAITYHDLAKAPNSNPELNANEYLQNFYSSNFQIHQFKFEDKSIPKKK